MRSPISVSLPPQALVERDARTRARNAYYRLRTHAVEPETKLVDLAIDEWQRYVAEGNSGAQDQHRELFIRTCESALRALLSRRTR